MRAPPLVHSLGSSLAQSKRARVSMLLQSLLVSPLDGVVAMLVLLRPWTSTDFLKNSMDPVCAFGEHRRSTSPHAPLFLVCALGEQGRRITAIPVSASTGDQQ